MGRRQTSGSLLQVFHNRRELLQIGLEVRHDVNRNGVGLRKIGALFKRIVLEPEDVQGHMSRFISSSYVKYLEALCHFASVSLVLLPVAANTGVKIAGA